METVRSKISLSPSVSACRFFPLQSILTGTRSFVWPCARATSSSLYHLSSLPSAYQTWIGRELLLSGLHRSTQHTCSEAMGGRSLTSRRSGKKIIFFVPSSKKTFFCRYARGNGMQDGRFQLTLSTTAFGEHTNFEKLLFDALTLSEKYPTLLRTLLGDGSVSSVSIQPQIMFEHASENPDHTIFLQPKYPLYNLPYQNSYPTIADIAQPISAILSSQDFIDLFQVWQIEISALLRSLAIRWLSVQRNGEELGPHCRRFIISHKNYMQRDMTHANSSASGCCPVCGRS